MFLLYLIFFISIIFSLRAISSISIALLLITGFIVNKNKTGKFFSQNLYNLFSIACFVFYIVQLGGLLYTHDPSQQWSSLRLKSSLLFVPIALCGCNFFNEKSRKNLLTAYSLILFSASLYCIVVAVIDYRLYLTIEAFFYHDLVKPIGQHAVQFSILILIALIFLFENFRKGEIILIEYIHIFLIIFFSIFLVFLSSKLMILIYVGYLIYFFTSHLKRKNNSKAIPIIILLFFLSLITVVLVTNNPISRRFNDVIKGNVNFIRQKKFTPGDYFNGLQFRLLQWRFTSEILTENNSWIIGVSAGDDQKRLDQKYISENMYIGEDYRHDRGFLGYNSHNQLLQSLLQSGIIGLLAFIFICVAMIRMAWKKKSRILTFTVITLLLFSFSESVFESQYGLLIFLFFPLFFSNE